MKALGIAFSQGREETNGEVASRTRNRTWYGLVRSLEVTAEADIRVSVPVILLVVKFASEDFRS